jgi:hypothetical protein
MTSLQNARVSTPMLRLVNQSLVMGQNYCPQHKKNLKMLTLVTNHKIKIHHEDNNFDFLKK